jgi:hypothetical protein
MSIYLASCYYMVTSNYQSRAVTRNKELEDILRNHNHSSQKSKARFFYITAILNCFWETIKQPTINPPVYCWPFHENRWFSKGFGITRTDGSLILILFQQTVPGDSLILKYLRNWNQRFFINSNDVLVPSFWNLGPTGKCRIYVYHRIAILKNQRTNSDPSQVE